MCCGLCINNELIALSYILQGTLNKATLFQDIPALCEKLDKVIREVFAYPEAVVDKLVVNIFQGRLQVSYFCVFMYIYFNF